ncbi:MAG: transglutaminase-like domain-containing protein [Aquabacterium sp.]
MTASTDSALQPTPQIDSDHPDVVAFARQHGGAADERERAIALTHAVRDVFRYDAYRIDLSAHGMRASTVIANHHGWCVPKAALLAAVCRAAGLGARVGYADVRNHLSTERMRRDMGTDLYIWHGYTDIRIDGRWIKATPAFNIELCTRFGLMPLDFDGIHDSLYHPYDRAGNRHMEYVSQRGSFDEMPLDRIRADFAMLYPHIHAAQREGADFDADVARETALR